MSNIDFKENLKKIMCVKIKDFFHLSAHSCSLFPLTTEKEISTVRHGYSKVFFIYHCTNENLFKFNITKI